MFLLLVLSQLLSHAEGVGGLGLASSGQLRRTAAATCPSPDPRLLRGAADAVARSNSRPTEAPCPPSGAQLQGASWPGRQPTWARASDQLGADWPAAAARAAAVTVVRVLHQSMDVGRA